MLMRYEHRGVTWIDLERPTRDEVMLLMKEYSLDPNVAEELLLPSPKTRMETRDTYLYLIFHFPSFKHSHRRHDQEIDIVLGKKFIITTRYDIVDPLHKFSKVFDVNSLLENCFGIVQEGPKHDRVYDIGEHSLLALKACSSTDPVIRFASLLHDIGKPDTYRIDTNHNVTFYNHEIVGAKIAKHICQRFRLTSDQTDLIVTLVRWHMFSVDEKQTDSAIRRIIRNIGVQNIDHMMVIREADRIGGGTQNATSWRLENFKKRIKEVLTKPFQITDLKINGQDVMDNLNIPPSRMVGEMLQKLFEEVLEDSAKNTREYLLSRIHQLQTNNNKT